MKDGTSLHAERRIQRVLKVMTCAQWIGDWEVTIRLAKAMGYDMCPTIIASEIHDEIAAPSRRLQTSVYPMPG